MTKYPDNNSVVILNYAGCGASNSSRHKNIVVLKVKEKNLDDAMALGVNRLMMFPVL
jgi:hypothetical protein